MNKSHVKGDKKKALLAYKDKLLNEIYYYKKRIVEARSNVNKIRSFEDDTSSDSDTEIVFLKDSDPSISQLKSQQAMLKTCLQATHELTNLEIVVSEVNVLVEEPVVEGESPVTEPGTWREVTAECCVDLVPFSITFYAHRGEGMFAPISYRGLKVVPLKSSHEVELAKSVLPGLRRPSDAVEVVRSYAVAHRSRRSTLARLADKFGAALLMEPKETGGYILKCANLLEVSWTLQNKWSPVARFHHQLKFDLEYMDESNLKTITAAHRQLSDPALETDERTLLLARIVSVCLQASEVLPGSPVRRATLNEEPEVPRDNTQRDSDVMAPPKTLPKKVKAKNKKSPPNTEITDSKPTKRFMEDEISNNNVKKPKIGNKPQEDPLNEDIQVAESSARKSKTAPSDKNKTRTSVKNKQDKNNANINSNRNKDDVDTEKIIDENKDIAGQIKNTVSAKKIGKPKSANKKLVNTESGNNVDADKTDKKQASDVNVVKENSRKATTKSALVKKRSVTSGKCSAENQETVKATKKVDGKNSAKKPETVENKVSNKDSDVNVIKIAKNITNDKGEVVKKVVKKLANDKPKVAEKVSDANEVKQNLPKTSINNKVASSESVKKSSTTSVVDKIKKPLNEKNDKISKVSNQNTNKEDVKKITKTSAFSEDNGNIKKITTGNIEKENSAQNKIISSKIPQKKMGTPKRSIKKMPLRISPRKPIPKSKTPLTGVNMKKAIKKPVTGIPRLVTQPKPKVT